MIDEAGIGSEFRDTHLLSEVKPRLLSRLKSMTAPQLSALNAHLRVSLPPCKRGPKAHIKYEDFTMAAEVRRRADFCGSVRKASDEVGYAVLPKIKHQAADLDAFRKHFLDIERRLEKFASLSITTTGGTTTLTMNQERVVLIEIFGTLASDVKIYFSGHRGFWVLNNRISGRFAVTAGVRGHRGATVGDGVTVLICDGNDIFPFCPN